LVKQAIRLNGADSMALMKLDVLDSLDEIKICIGYELDGKFLESPPVLLQDWHKLSPVYEIVEGWKASTKEVRSWRDLPEQAVSYVKKLEVLCGCPLSFLSYGPERERVVQISRLF
ncbi:MAG: adenylosuccinate synthase, partial [Chlamydiae bacterium]|nr:adenylosuccinate synthase [Chlamydiota bacterium]